MQIQSVVARGAAATAHSEALPRLRGRRLMVARAMWLMSALISALRLPISGA